MMATFRLAAGAVLVGVLAFTPLFAFAQGSDPGAPADAVASSGAGATKPSFSVKPVLLDSEDTDAVTIGAEYEFSGDLFTHDFGGSDIGSGSIDADAPLGGVTVRLESRGTVATSAERNPKNFLDTTASFNLKYSGSGIGTFIVGATFKYETDQKFENEQSVFGARAAWGKQNFLMRNDFLALDLGYGRVEPGEDTERKAALGSTELDSFNRIDFEALYLINTGSDIVPVIELNYRFYHEVGAPAAIEAAGLENYQLGTVRLSLPNNFFVAYSIGKLPFDRSSDRIVALGLSYKLF